MLCLSILFVLLFYKYTKHGKLVGLKAPIYFLSHMIFLYKRPCHLRTEVLLFLPF